MNVIPVINFSPVKVQWFKWQGNTRHSHHECVWIHGSELRTWWLYSLKEIDMLCCFVTHQQCIAVLNSVTTKWLICFIVSNLANSNWIFGLLLCSLLQITNIIQWQSFLLPSRCEATALWDRGLSSLSLLRELGGSISFLIWRCSREADDCTKNWPVFLAPPLLTL